MTTERSQSDVTNLMLLGWFMVGAVVLLALPPVQAILLSVYLLILAFLGLPLGVIFQYDTIDAVIKGALAIMESAGSADQDYIGRVISYIKQADSALRVSTTITSLIITAPFALISVRTSLHMRILNKRLKESKFAHEIIYADKSIPPERKCALIMLNYGLISKETAESIKTFEDVVRIFVTIRERVAFPANVLARCYPYGSKERLILLNYGRRGKVIVGEIREERGS
ncbi:MAG: hypothetical protein QXY99_01345 [Thermoproteota archaeon]